MKSKQGQLTGTMIVPFFVSVALACVVCVQEGTVQRGGFDD